MSKNYSTKLPKSNYSSEIIYYKEPDTNVKSLFNSESILTLPNPTTSISDQRIKSFHSTSTGSRSEVKISTIKHRENLEKYPKKEYKKISWGENAYEGHVLVDNLHGSGFYFTQQNGEKYFYDGLFYVNKLEGYGQVFYENGTHFQGLFKNHLRYGPGILTYPDGSQDVGFWNGFRLIRLACPVGYDFVPMLASTPVGKSKLMCSKYVIPLCTEKIDKTKEALENIGVPDEILDNWGAVYNKDIRNPNSLFFHKDFFDYEFFGNKHCEIKVLLDDSDDADGVVEEVQDKNPNILERIENLKNKIHEVNETLQTYIAIKMNLERKVNVCNKCCEETNSEKGVSELEARDPESHHVLASNIELQQPRQLFDASLGSLAYNQDISSENLTVFSLSVSTIKTPSLVVVDTCKCDENEYKDGLQNLEEQLQNIITQETFYRNIRDELQKKLNRITQRELNKHAGHKFKMMVVDELWAWNNEESLINIQQHCFKNRQSEDMVNFSVPNLILGNRKEFGNPGKHEELCHKFLIACGKGKTEFVRECLRQNKVDPDVADAKGNTGIFFAAAKSHPDVISELTNFGANLNQLNDEQLTPLSLCLLKYICVNNNCKNWEKAFLPETKVCNVPDLPQWYKVKSFQSLVLVPSINSSCTFQDLQESSQQLCTNLRIMDLFSRMSNVHHKKNSLPKSMGSTMYVFDLNCKTDSAKQTEEDNTINIETELEPIHLTMMTLLDYGANPNVCEVPYPTLVLSLFTENPDLVKELIKANADIGILIDENMSCLHIAASLPPLRENALICTILVKYGCNPNLRTLPDHWSDRKSTFTGSLPDKCEIEDLGKNALHLLCMRTDYPEDSSDYFCMVAKVLLETNLDTNHTYLGHTPLSLAVISGNIRLVQCLLKTNTFDPYKTLQYGMGNILTIYALKRFDNIVKLEKCKAMLSALFDMNLNVLYKVEDTENVVAFVEDKDNFFDQFIEENTKKVAKKNVKPKKVNKRSASYAVTEFLKNIARQTIIKQIQLYATEVLFEFTEEDILADYQISATLASEYLTPQIVHQNLKKLFEYKKFESDRLDQEHIKTLLEFSNLHQKPTKKTKANKNEKKEKSKKGKETEKKKETEKAVKTEVKEDFIGDLVRELDMTLNLHFVPPKFLIPPGIDDPQKYKICFHCLRSKDKELKSCPRCQLIYFCSLQCNKANLKLKTQHGCNLVFYDMTDHQRSELTHGVFLAELVTKAKQQCIARLTKIRESKLIEEENKLLQMWRADTYGTKFLQIKPLLDKAVTKKKDKQINWSIAMLKEILERNFQKSPGETSLYSLENLLLKLHGREWYRLLGKEKSEGTIRTKQSWSTRRSTIGGSTLHSLIFQSFDSDARSSRSCRCQKKSSTSRTKAKLKSASKKQEKRAHEKPERPLMNYEENENTAQFQNVASTYPVQESITPVVKKLPKIPQRYQRFVEIIETYFPDLDFSAWLLPYACYSDGQLYYKFCYNNDLFKESYSLS